MLKSGMGHGYVQHLGDTMHTRGTSGALPLLHPTRPRAERRGQSS